MNNNKKNTTERTVASSKASSAQPGKENTKTLDFAFGTMNYILLVAGVVLLGIGYILLSGGGSDHPNVFNPAMFDSRRLVVAPLMIVIGLIVEICAIMFRPKEKEKPATDEA